MSKPTVAPAVPPGVPYDITLHVRDACLCLHTQRAARALARRFDAAFRPLDLTNGQFSLLMALNRPNPPTQGVVAALLAMDRTTLTAALKPLAERGLIAIAPNPSDRRNRLLSLTPTGHALLAQAVPIWDREHAELEATLPLSQPHILRANLVSLSADPKNLAKPAKEG